MKRWQLVQELFAATVDLDPGTRARVLAERAGGDAGLIREVEGLLEADGHPADPLAGTAEDLAQAIGLEAPAEVLCGQRFDRYRVEAHLASGGMGHVYRATHTTAAIERPVAIKVLRPRADRAELPARFAAERATLAGLTHENIVTFLDAGALPDGRPYLVMELVEGVPFTEWVVTQELDRRGVLGLFLQILAAVQCAHRSLVVHGDLKPSNVLINTQGVPKLLDFGIAAALAAPAAAEPGGPGPWTPGYASPEQLRGDPLTTGSDVYSLGVMLREVLREASAGRSADLEAIVRMATAADPAQRYGSVDGLAADVRRSLAGEPVAARPHSLRYRAACFLRRHRWPLVGTAAVLAALVVGWVGSDLSRQRAEREASIGWRAHAEARFVSRLLTDLVMRAATDDAELGARAVQHLEAALRSDLGELPEARAMTHLALAELYRMRGELEPATDHAERARTLCRTVRGLSPADGRRAEALLAKIAADRSARSR